MLKRTTAKFVVMAGAALAALHSFPAHAYDVNYPFEYIAMSGTSGIASWTANSSVVGTGTGDWRTNSYSADSSWITPLFNYPTSSQTPMPGIPGCTGCTYMWYWNDALNAATGHNGVNEAYFRGTFSMPSLTGAAYPFDAILQIRADDDAEVWFNGIKVLTDADLGTINDRGSDYIFSVDVTNLLVVGGANILAIRATDGSLTNPTDYVYEHVAAELRIRTTPEPGTWALFASAMGLAAHLRRRRAV